MTQQPGARKDSAINKKIDVTKGKIRRVKIWLRHTEKAVEKKARKATTQKEMKEIARTRARLDKDWRDVKQCELELREIQHTMKARRQFLK